MAGWWADVRNREKRVVVGSEPQVWFEKPGPSDKYGWDESLYARGMVNVKGHYEPIEVSAKAVEEDNGGYELLPSQNYKTALLATEVIPKALNPIDMDTIKYAIFATAALSILTLLAVAGLYGG